MCHQQARMNYINWNKGIYVASLEYATVQSHILCNSDMPNRKLTPAIQRSLPSFSLLKSASFFHGIKILFLQQNQRKISSQIYNINRILKFRSDE